MIFFITQELCDEIQMYLSLQYMIDVEITRYNGGIEILAATVDDEARALQIFIAYLEGIFRDANISTVSGFCSISQLLGQTTLGEAARRNAANN